MVKYPDRKDLNGIVVVNKPGGMTSHDVVEQIRKKLRMQRVGHAGTLDPMATGVLIVLIGRGTRLFEKFAHFDKAYRATMILGRQTWTSDIEGKIIDNRPFSHVTRGMVEKIFNDFIGVRDQVPPMVSAVKVNGKRLYELARQGKEVARSPRRVRFDRIELLNFDLPYVEFLLECSKGTYVRQFAEDVGKQLLCGACVSQIERTKVGPYRIEDAIKLDDIKEIDVKDFIDEINLHEEKGN
ncbi:MAG: tRNA pseudouridine(55) synthase TruB [Candidatus Omnitrophota bacterium]